MASNSNRRSGSSGRSGKRRAVQINTGLGPLKGVPQVQHVPMETHSSAVKWDGDHLTIWESSQGVYDAVLFPAARALGLPFNKVRVICKYMGGGFGSKLELGKHAIIAALLSCKTGRPVKLALTREESLLCVGNRPDAKMTIKAGVRKDGTLTALKLTSVATSWNSSTAIAAPFVCAPAIGAKAMMAAAAAVTGHFTDIRNWKFR